MICIAIVLIVIFNFGFVLHPTDQKEPCAPRLPFFVTPMKASRNDGAGQSDKDAEATEPGSEATEPRLIPMSRKNTR